MNLVGVKVKHKAFGNGVIVSIDDDMFTVDFCGKHIELAYPSAFEKFLKAEDEDVQAAIIQSIQDEKTAEEKKTPGRDGSIKSSRRAQGC